MLEGVLGPSMEELEAMTGTMKRKFEEGEMITTE